MFRMILLRALLVALPIVLWFIWADVAKRRGKPMGSTPWAWLIGVGLVLAAISLLASGFFGASNDPNASYVPVETGANGQIVPGAR